MTVHQLHAPMYDGPDIAEGCVGSMELCRRSGISYRQLDYWCRTELLFPVAEVHPGSGMSRSFPTVQIERATVLKDLLDAGLSLQTIRDVLDGFIETGQVRLNDRMVLHLATEL